MGIGHDCRFNKGDAIRQRDAFGIKTRPSTCCVRPALATPRTFWAALYNGTHHLAFVDTINGVVSEDCCWSLGLVFDKEMQFLSPCMLLERVLSVFTWIALLGRPLRASLPLVQRPPSTVFIRFSISNAPYSFLGSFAKMASTSHSHIYRNTYTHIYGHWCTQYMSTYTHVRTQTHTYTHSAIRAHMPPWTDCCQ